MNTPRLPQLSSRPSLKALSSSLIQAIQAFRTPLLLTLALVACDGKTENKGNKPTPPTVNQKASSPAGDPPPFEIIKLKSNFVIQMPGPLEKNKQLNKEYKSLLDDYFTRLRIAFSDGNDVEVKDLLLKFQADTLLSGLTNARAYYSRSKESDQRRLFAVRTLFDLCEGKADREDHVVSAFIDFLKAYRNVEKTTDIDNYWKAYRKMHKISVYTNFGLEEIGESPWNLLGKQMQLTEEAKKEKESRRENTDLRKQ
jgi:hypothetical protein